MYESTTPIERIIAKFDNDFNPDQSDWIPRIAAWTIDAMSILKVFIKVNKNIKLNVNHRIAFSTIPIDKSNIRVFDSNNNELFYAKSEKNLSTGNLLYPNTINSITTSTVINTNQISVPEETIFQGSPIDPLHQNTYNIPNKKIIKNFVVIDENKIELNFDTEYIYVRMDVIATYYSSTYNCPLPIIPNNGNLLEAIVSFCMYKMLLRGYKHPVFSLTTNNPGINPYLAWEQAKNKVKTSVILDEQNKNINELDKLNNSSFYLYTFG